MNLPFLKSPIGEDPIIIEAEFSATVSRVFEAWTNPDDVSQWFGSDEGGPEVVNIDLQEGGRWQFSFAEKEGKTDSLSGKYTRIEQDKHLEFTWVHTLIHADGNTEESPESIVSISFEPTDTGSFSRLTHKSVSSESTRNNIGGGWNASFSKIKRLVEQ